MAEERAGEFLDGSGRGLERKNTDFFFDTLIMYIVCIALRLKGG